MKNKIREEGDSPVALRQPHFGAYGHDLKKLQPTESSHRSRLLAGATAHGGFMLECEKKGEIEIKITNGIPIPQPFFLVPAWMAWW